MIEVLNVSRSFTTKKGIIHRKTETMKAVNNISFSVNQGEIFGLLGPNGAGKTTTIKMLTTLLTPNEGKITILGYDTVKRAKEVQKRINFIYGGERSLYWRLTAKDNLIYFADLYNIEYKQMQSRVQGLLKLVGLEKYADKKVETFSKGMKQRLQIARALINDPEIVFMDEPTIGLDPAATHLLHEIIIDLKMRGKTIILTTHYMKEAEELCDRIAFIKQGEIVDIQSPSAHINTAAKNSGKTIKSIEDVYMHYFGAERGVE
ncbi:MAG: type transport system ATP-binding protein [Clostridiales bacterium]|jgi:ABC-2 type transport system ATP-binding protein|nr:type transport system ATP-binding protein [Clostridiales bacterium]MDN5299076.1 type transport system ATP-binding protein [Clostridiales bacterium]